MKPSQLVNYYSGCGVGGACITDNGNLCAAVQLYNSCKKAGIKPIIGIEVNIAHDKKKKEQRSSTLVLIAKNITGFYNLVKISTIGSMYFYYFPRIDLEVLEKYSEGIIALSSDLKGIGASEFFSKGINGIADAYDKYVPIFKDGFFWELQPTQTESQRVYNEALVEMAKGFDAFKLVASGDPHYLSINDKELHQHWLASKNFRNPSYEYPFRGEFHVLNETEMVQLFTLLHGYSIIDNEQFVSALMQPKAILEMIEPFDLRQGTKVPQFQE